MESKNRLKASFHFDKEQYARDHPDALDGLTEPNPDDPAMNQYVRHTPNEVRITGRNMKPAIGDVHLVGDYAVIIKRTDPIHDFCYRDPFHVRDYSEIYSFTCATYFISGSRMASPTVNGIKLAWASNHDSVDMSDFLLLARNVETLTRYLLGNRGVVREDSPLDILDDSYETVVAHRDEMYAFLQRNQNNYNYILAHMDQYFDHAVEVVREAVKAGYWIKTIEHDWRAGETMICPDKEITRSALMRGFAWLPPSDLEKRFGGDPKAADKAFEDAIVHLNHLEHTGPPEYELFAAPVLISGENSVRIMGDMRRVNMGICGDHKLRDLLENLTALDVKDAIECGVGFVYDFDTSLDFDGTITIRGQDAAERRKELAKMGLYNKREGIGMKILRTINTQTQAVFAVSGLISKAGKVLGHLMEAKYNPQAFATLQKENPDQLKKDLGAFYRWGCEIAARNMADSQPATARERQESLDTMKMSANNGRLTIAQRVKRWFKHNEKNSGLSKTAAQIANVADQRYEAAAIVGFLKENGILANRHEFRTLSGEMANVADFRNEFVCKMAGAQNGEAILQKFDAWLSARLEAADHLQAGKMLTFQGDGKGERMRETAADVVVSKFIPPQAAEAAAQHPQGLPEETVRTLQMEKTDAIITGQLAQEQPVVASVKTLNRIVPAPQTEAALEREVSKVVQEVMPAPEPYKPDPWLQERQAKIDEASAISWEMQEIAHNLGAYPRTYLGDETTPQGKPITVQGVSMSIDLERLDMETGGRLDELMGPRVAALREAAWQYTLTKAAEKYDYCSYDAEKNEFRIAGRLYDPVNLSYMDAAANDDMAAMSAAMPLIPDLTLSSIRLTAEINIRQCFNSDKEASKQYCQTYSMKMPVPEGIRDMPAFRESGCVFQDGQAFVVSRYTNPSPEIPSADAALELLESKSAKFFNHEAIAAARKEFADAERQRAEEAMSGRQEEQERTGMAMGM